MNSDMGSVPGPKITISAIKSTKKDDERDKQKPGEIICPILQKSYNMISIPRNY